MDWTVTNNYGCLCAHFSTPETILNSGSNQNTLCARSLDPGDKPTSTRCAIIGEQNTTQSYPLYIGRTEKSNFGSDVAATAEEEAAEAANEDDGLKEVEYTEGEVVNEGKPELGALPPP